MSHRAEWAAPLSWGYRGDDGSQYAPWPILPTKKGAIITQKNAR